MIRRARPDEAGAISALAFRSKALWGYDAAAMGIFREELTLSPVAVERQPTFVLECEGELSGFYSLAFRSDGNLELDHLFVDPEKVRGGLGGRLLDHALAQARALGSSGLLVQSDPNAEGFYLARGGEVVERIASSIPGRTLPLLHLSCGRAGEVTP